ncbi:MULTISPECIES: diguanylate cyclase domain-containing protein [Planktothricoides]|uniref:Diguanylate cyclase n=1 Tax=Planktothricoides raciborskii GIHE-MW2 TaxID=2792601 RepID=A0AAU8JLP7_9CYAN|nr:MULTISPECIES: diguanylate cyclase [Planktothricoides]
MKRAGDLVARYGGEEFAVILPNTHAPGAMEVGEIIRTHGQKLQIAHRKSSVSGSVTVSLGVIQRFLRLFPRINFPQNCWLPLRIKLFIRQNLKDAIAFCLSNCLLVRYC